MDAVAWKDFQEKVTFLVSLLTGPFVWFASKYLYNKWEKKRMDIQVELEDTSIQKKEAELLVVYEGIIRRASDEAITKSDRWTRLESEWNQKFNDLSIILREQHNKLIDNESIIKRMSEESTIKENRWVKEFEGLERMVSEQRSEINVLKSENICLNLEIKTLQTSKVALEVENVNLKERVVFLENKDK